MWGLGFRVWGLGFGVLPAFSMCKSFFFPHHLCAEIQVLQQRIRVAHVYIAVCGCDHAGAVAQRWLNAFRR